MLRPICIALLIGKIAQYPMILFGDHQLFRQCPFTRWAVLIAAGFRIAL